MGLGARRSAHALCRRRFPDLRRRPPRSGGQAGVTGQTTEPTAQAESGPVAAPSGKKGGRAVWAVIGRPLPKTLTPSPHRPPPECRPSPRQGGRTTNRPPAGGQGASAQVDNLVRRILRRRSRKRAVFPWVPAVGREFDSPRLHSSDGVKVLAMSRKAPQIAEFCETCGFCAVDDAMDPIRRDVSGVAAGPRVGLGGAEQGFGDDGVAGRQPCRGGTH
jgi:hypothetical protein